MHRIMYLSITSRDTTFRAEIYIIADYLKIDQKKLKKRLMIAIPLFAASALLTQIDFNLLWRYFSWANQATAAIALWIATMYLFIKGKNYVVSLIPALFMTYMVLDRKSTRLNSSHVAISYAVFCL